MLPPPHRVLHGCIPHVAFLLSPDGTAYRPVPVHNTSRPFPSAAPGPTPLLAATLHITVIPSDTSKRKSPRTKATLQIVSGCIYYQVGNGAERFPLRNAVLEEDSVPSSFKVSHPHAGSLLLSCASLWEKEDWWREVKSGIMRATVGLEGLALVGRQLSLADFPAHGSLPPTNGLSAFRVRCRRSGTVLALIAVRKGAMVSQPALAKEVANHRRLAAVLPRHDNIVFLYAAFQTDRALYFVEDLTEGGSLREVVRQGLGGDILWAIMGMAQALCVCHSAGIAVGDFTGVFAVDRDGRVRLRSLRRAEGPDASYESKAADWYSLGAHAYHLYCGAPYRGSFPDDMAPDLKDLFTSLLQDDSRARLMGWEGGVGDHPAVRGASKACPVAPSRWTIPCPAKYPFPPPVEDFSEMPSAKPTQMWEYPE